MKSDGMPVSKPGASKPRFLTSSRPGVPIGWTVSDSPFRDDQALLVAEARGHGRRDEEQDQPEVGEERRHLRVLVAVAVDVARAVGVGRLADAEPAPRARPRATSAALDPGHRRAIGQARVEERLRLGDPDRRHVPPQPRRPVERADDDRDDEDDQGPSRRWRDLKIAKAPSRSSTPTAAGPEDRVVAGVDLVHRRRVVAGRAEREVGQLLEGHPDDREDRQEDDLDDGEVDRRQEPPQPLPELGQRVGRRAGGRGRANGGR